tara:strand:+ start:113864 stop:115645 length:1782 start_codon:yes stop_codon:yes gene_type:complete
MSPIANVFLNKSIKKNGAERVLFLLLFSYVILRAIYVPPLHDEVATFFHYIETGDIWSDSAMLDANNHLLNSYLSRFSYLIFGEGLWALRLPNVLTYAIYFWSVVSIVKQLKTSFAYWMALLALNTLPFVIEYFAMTRGYGLGIAFLMGSIAWIVKWQQHGKTIYLMAGMLLAWLCVFANLIFINSFVLLAFFVVVKSISTFSLQKSWFSILTVVSSSLALWPLITFGLRMKNAGALYYGSLDGLWEVTGKSLSNYTLFSAHVWIKWMLVAVIVSIIIWSLRYMITNKFRKSLASVPLFLVYLFLGNLVVTLILAWFFEVNYPEDRAGIHFVLFFILSITFLLDDLSVPIVSVVLFFFPLSFLVKFNFSQTVVTPDQTLSYEFYRKVRKKLEHHQSVQIYPTQSLIWPYYERSQSDKILVKMGREVEPSQDMILTRKPFYSQAEHTDFRSILFDPLTADHLLQNKRDRVVRYSVNFELNESYETGRQELARHKVEQGKFLTIHLKGLIYVQGVNDITVEIEGLNSAGEREHFIYFPLRWYYGSKANEYKFELNQGITLHQYDIDELRISLINQTGSLIKVEDSDLYLEYLSDQ